MDANHQQSLAGTKKYFYEFEGLKNLNLNLMGKNTELNLRNQKIFKLINIFEGAFNILI